MARRKKPICVRSQHATSEDKEDIVLEVMLCDGSWMHLGMTYLDFVDLRNTVCELMQKLAERN